MKTNWLKQKHVKTGVVFQGLNLLNTNEILANME